MEYIYIIFEQRQTKYNRFLIFHKAYKNKIKARKEFIKREENYKKEYMKCLQKIETEKEYIYHEYEDKSGVKYKLSMRKVELI